MRAEKLREDDRRALQTLRERLVLARARRKTAMHGAVRTCRRARAAVAETIAAFRAAEMKRLAANIGELRAKARARCQARRYRIQQAGGGVVKRERAKLAEQRRLQAQLSRLATTAKKHKARLSTAKERRSEDDDYVRGNLPASLVPVFNRVAKRIRGGARTTRTEAFLEWAEEHPDEVLEYQGHATDREVAELVQEHERVAKQLRKGKAHYQRVAGVPF